MSAKAVWGENTVPVERGRIRNLKRFIKSSTNEKATGTKDESRKARGEKTIPSQCSTSKRDQPFLKKTRKNWPKGCAELRVFSRITKDGGNVLFYSLKKQQIGFKKYLEKKLPSEHISFR